MRPLTGTYKSKLSTFFYDGTGAIAAIVRDSRGQAVAGVAETFVQVQDADSAEALALRRGLQLVQDIGCSRVVWNQIA